MKINFVSAIISVALFTSICACSKQEGHAEYESADSTASSSLSVEESDSTQTVSQSNDNTIIRTADLRFRVKNVKVVSEQIEDLVAQNKGFISYSNHDVNINRQEVTQISADSSNERTYFSESSTITLKVPNKSLDNTLRRIASMAEFLNSKTLKAEDVYLELLSNQLKIKRNTTFQNNVNTANKSKKTFDIEKVAIIEDYKLDKQTIADEAVVSNLSLNQKIAFSTITIEIYQRDGFTDSKIAFDKVLKPYEEPFYLQLWNSVAFGVVILENIILAIAKLWALIVIGIIAYFVYKNRIKS